MGSFPPPVDTAGFCRENLDLEHHPGEVWARTLLHPLLHLLSMEKEKVFEVPQCQQCRGHQWGRWSRCPCGCRSLLEVAPHVAGSNISRGMGSHRRAQWWNSISRWEMLRSCSDGTVEEPQGFGRSSLEAPGVRRICWSWAELPLWEASLHWNPRPASTDPAGMKGTRKAPTASPAEVGQGELGINPCFSKGPGSREHQERSLSCSVFLSTKEGAVPTSKDLGCVGSEAVPPPTPFPCALQLAGGGKEGTICEHPRNSSWRTFFFLKKLRGDVEPRPNKFLSPSQELCFEIPNFWGGSEETWAGFSSPLTSPRWWHHHKNVPTRTQDLPLGLGGLFHLSGRPSQDIPEKTAEMC